MTAPRTAADRLYRWEPVEGDCRVHAGPHEGFRCNGAIGRYIEAEAAAPYREALERLVAKWQAEAEAIEDASEPGNKVRRAIAAEALRACARDLRGAALLRREVGE